MSDLTLATREQFFALKLKEEIVPCPEFGEGIGILIVELTALERDTYEISLHEPSKDGKSTVINMLNARAKLVAKAARNADRSRMFTDADAATLATKAASVIDRLYDVAERLSGMGRHQRTVGNVSAPTTGDGTTSASLAI